ncbi:hypothetical protein ACS0TY_029680 [Phlomoides rotata]
MENNNKCKSIWFNSPGGILNMLATSLHGSIHTAPSIHYLRLGLLGVLLSLVFFLISTHFTAPSEIPSAPTVLQLGSFHHISRPPTDVLRPIIPDNAYIICLIAAAGTELADAYSPNIAIASSPGKEVHDPWAFYLHAALIYQAFAYCRKFPTTASRISLGRVSVPVWLIILSDQQIIISLTKQIQNCLSFEGITCIHVLHIRPEFAPRNIAIHAPSRQSHEPLIHSL